MSAWEDPNDPPFLERLRFHAGPFDFQFGTAPRLTYPLKPFQIPIFISLAPPKVRELPVSTPYCPALLDLGLNHNFVIHESHLELVSTRPEAFQRGADPVVVRSADGTRTRADHLVANLWLRSIAPDGRELAPARLLNLSYKGGACYRNSSDVRRAVLSWTRALKRARPGQRRVPVVDGPPLPLLGLMALHAGQLRMQLECRPGGGTVSLFPPRVAAG